MTDTSLRLLKERIQDPKFRTLIDALGIEFTYLGPDSVRASMPVDERTVQYFNLLHGGASVALAETVASCAAAVHVDLAKKRVVGLEINANHVRGVQGGQGSCVHAEAKPLHLGSRTQLWSIDIRDDQGRLVCVSRCTMAVIDA